MHEDDVTAARHNLWLCLSILHPHRFPLADKILLCSGMYSLALGTVFLDGFVLLGKHLPAEAYPHLVNGIRHQLLDMETVIDEHRFWEHCPHGQHHGRGQIGCHGLYPTANLTGDFLQDFRYRVGGNAAYHRCQGPLAAMSRLVGQDGIDLTIRQAGLVQAHVIIEVVGEKHVLLSMFQLLPVAVVTDLLLVLLAKSLTVQTIAGSKRGNAYGRGLNLPLLKKKRTPRSGASRRIRTTPTRS